MIIFIMDCVLDIPVYISPTAETVQNIIYKERVPAVLRHVSVGPCIEKWTPEYLKEKLSSKSVKVHYGHSPQLNFIEKNFSYKTVSFGEMMKHELSQMTNDSCRNSSEEKNYYYLRALGEDIRGRDTANLEKHFPEIAKDFNIPDFVPSDKIFSSVFRVCSAGVQLWTHYDIMDNVLVQIRGQKRAVLFPPCEALNMYLVGDKSAVLDVDNYDIDKFPNFAKVKRFETLLMPGDVLFIPALWFHNVIAHDFSVAVNIFWHHLNSDLYDKKDPYGNKDIIPASRALLGVENALKQLENLPEVYRDFYSRRMIARIQVKGLSPYANNA